MATVTVTNTDANLSAKTIVIAENAQTITGLQTFSRSTNPPFAIAAGAAVVPNLIAESVSGGTASVTTLTATGAITFSNAMTQSGGTSFSGGVNINTTALTLNSGQIQFPAAQIASTDVNNLDDYEEGNFTMTLVSSGGGTPTYTNRTGFYVKKGKDVSINGIFTLATLGTLAAGGITITGLPFTSENTATNYAGIAMPYFQNLAANKVLVGGYIAPNSSTITMTSLAAAGTSTAGLLVADISGTFEFIFSSTYRASA